MPQASKKIGEVNVYKYLAKKDRRQRMQGTGLPAKWPDQKKNEINLR